MLNFYNNLSPATKLVIQSFLSVLGSVLAGVAAAGYQSYTHAGHLDLQALVNVSLVTFALLFGKTMYDWVPGHAQQLIQSYKDSEVQLRDALQRQQNIASVALNSNQSKQVQSSTVQPQMPMIIQNSSPITPEHMQAISQQIALNLANMATTTTVPPQPPALSAPVIPQPVPQPAQQDAYLDPLRNSAVLPAYTPSTYAMADQATQKVPFSVPTRPATIS